MAVTRLVLDAKKKLQEETRKQPASTIRVNSDKSGGGGKKKCC